VSGRVVVLNGTSSSGKTSLGRALQERLLPEVWLLVGVDTFITLLPWGLYGTAEGHTINADGSIDAGPAFSAEYERWITTVAALVHRGSNVILDEVFLRGGDDQRRWGDALAGVDVTWVGVHCDVDELERRERARGDRDVGMAAHQAAIVHVGVRYDLEIDSTSDTPVELAATIAQSQTG
jgi:chloramphenicol 3-O phosphotransferase